MLGVLPILLNNAGVCSWFFNIHFVFTLFKFFRSKYILIKLFDGAR